MANLNGFDANEVEPATPYTPLPVNRYLVKITESEMKQTKSQTGGYLELTFLVLEGQYKGRTQKDRLNLKNANEKAVQIARAELSAICRAVGVMKPRDSVDLHNIPLVIDVDQKKDKETGKIYNEVKGYYKKESITVPVSEINQIPDDAPPWMR